MPKVLQAVPLGGSMAQGPSALTVLDQEPQGVQLPTLGSHKQGGDAISILGFHLGACAHEDLHDLQVIARNRLMQSCPASVAAMVGVCFVLHENPHCIHVLALTGCAQGEARRSARPLAGPGQPRLHSLVCPLTHSFNEWSIIISSPCINPRIYN